MAFDSLRRAVTFTAIAGSVTACAAVWGFEEPIDLADASIGRDGDVGIDATAIDSSAADTTATDAPDPDSRAADSASFDAGSAADATTNDASALDASALDASALDADAGGDLDATGGACPGACVASPGPGWLGPFALTEATDGGSADPCAAPTTEALHLTAAPTAPPASCECSCGAPSNVACSAPVATFWGRYCNVGCVGAGGAAEAIGACSSISAATMACGAQGHVSFGASVPEGGSCVPVSVVDAGAITWAAAVRLCSPPGDAGGCDAGACFSPPIGPGEPPPLCVAQVRPVGAAGPVACPPSFDVLHEYGDGGTPYSEGAVDERTCACSCGAPTGVSCTGTVELYGGATCGGNAAATYATGSACNALTGTLASATASPEGGSCPSYGGPTGTLTPGTPYTICCTR